MKNIGILGLIFLVSFGVALHFLSPEQRMTFLILLVLAIFFALGIIVLIVISFIQKFKQNTLDDNKFQSISSVKKFLQLSPSELARLVGRVYQNDGYHVQHIERSKTALEYIKARKNGESNIIYIKQNPLNHETTRAEIENLISSKSFATNNSTIFITTGRLHPEAYQLTYTNPRLVCIDGECLLKLYEKSNKIADPFA